MSLSPEKKPYDFEIVKVCFSPLDGSAPETLLKHIAYQGQEPKFDFYTSMDTFTKLDVTTYRGGGALSYGMCGASLQSDGKEFVYSDTLTGCGGEDLECDGMILTDGKVHKACRFFSVDSNGLPIASTVRWFDSLTMEELTATEIATLEIERNLHVVEGCMVEIPSGDLVTGVALIDDNGNLKVPPKSQKSLGFTECC